MFICMSHTLFSPNGAVCFHLSCMCEYTSACVHVHEHRQIRARQFDILWFPDGNFIFFVTTAWPTDLKLGSQHHLGVREITDYFLGFQDHWGPIGHLTKHAPSGAPMLTECILLKCRIEKAVVVTRSCKMENLVNFVNGSMAKFKYIVNNWLKLFQISQAHTLIG